MKDSKFTPFGAKEEALMLATEHNKDNINATIDNILLDADKILQWFIDNDMVAKV